jgi:hypothetical protein
MGMPTNKHHTYTNILSLLFLKKYPPIDDANSKHKIGSCIVAGLLSDYSPFDEASADIDIGLKYAYAVRLCVSYMLGDTPVVSKENCIGSMWGINLFSAFLAFVGYGMVILLMAVIVIMMMQRTSSYTAFRAKVDRVTEEMEYYGLPHDLQTRIKTYYEYLWIHQTRMGSHSMYLDKDLSTNLRSDIALFLHRDFIKKVPLFHNCSNECLVAIVVVLRSAIYLPDDWVVRKGEAGRHLFIIRIGVVAVIEEGKKEDAGAAKKKGSITSADMEHSEEKGYNIVATLEEGSFFGEIFLFSLSLHLSFFIRYHVASGFSHRDYFLAPL